MLLIVTYRRRPVSLRELLPVGAQNHGHMREHRRLPLERTVDGDLFRRVRNVIGTPNDMGDPHCQVVRDDREVVDGGAIAPQDDEVVKVTSVKADPAVHRVVPGQLFIRHEEADGERRSCVELGTPLGWGQTMTAAIVGEGDLLPV